MNTTPSTPSPQERPTRSALIQPRWGAAEGSVVLTVLGVVLALAAAGMPWYRLEIGPEAVSAEVTPAPVLETWQGWSTGRAARVGDLEVVASAGLQTVVLVTCAVLAVVGWLVMIGKAGRWVLALALAGVVSRVVSHTHLVGLGRATPHPAGSDPEVLFGADLWRLALGVVVLGALTRWWAAPEGDEASQPAPPDEPSGPAAAVEA